MLFSAIVIFGFEEISFKRSSIDKVNQTGLMDGIWRLFSHLPNAMPWSRAGDKPMCNVNAESEARR